MSDENDIVEILKVKITSDFLKNKEIITLLDKVFPNKGLSISTFGESHTMFSSVRGGIKESFSTIPFTNQVVKLTKLHEKEYILLSHEEYNLIVDFLKNYEIIS